MAEIDKVMSILRRNQDKTFVKRILKPDNFPVLDLGNGDVATHKMSWGEVDTPKGRKFVVYPTVLWNGKELQDYGDSAFDHVMQTGNYIEFDTPDEADWFSRNYKRAWQGARAPKY